MKDTEARNLAKAASERSMESMAKTHALKVETNSKIQTLEETILNLTKRLRLLEEKVFPTCQQCGQRLPEGFHEPRDMQEKLL